MSSSMAPGGEVRNCNSNKRVGVRIMCQVLTSWTALCKHKVIYLSGYFYSWCAPHFMHLTSVKAVQGEQVRLRGNKQNGAHRERVATTARDLLCAPRMAAQNVQSCTQQWNRKRARKRVRMSVVCWAQCVRHVAGSSLMEKMHGLLNKTLAQPSRSLHAFAPATQQLFRMCNYPNCICYYNHQHCGGHSLNILKYRINPKLRTHL